ncbi:MAG: Rid family detoxifying hydrolase [Candidatus Dormiibacterota bacterium]
MGRRGRQASLPESGDGSSFRPILMQGVPPPAPPYSLATAAAGFVFVSGQRPLDATSGDIPGGFPAQAHQVFRNVGAVLEAGGSGLDRVVKVNVYLADLRHFAELNAIYEQYFQPPYPARTTVGCALRGILIEVDVIALECERGVTT